jgi:hypothetical protein
MGRCHPLKSLLLQAVADVREKYSQRIRSCRSVPDRQLPPNHLRFDPSNQQLSRLGGEIELI